jgi:hypothetical protein
MPEATPDVLRLVVAVVVVGLLARAARPAWQHRRLALRIWSRIRPRHVLGSLGLLAVVLGVALALLQFVPVTRFGLGSAVGVTGNAVFAPVEEVSARSGGGDFTAPGAPSAGGLQGPALAAVGGFLALLVALFPWLAYVEERVFREGLERASARGEAWTALRFGLVHLVMLVPLAAALAIGVAGFFYGRVYRRAYARTAARGEAVLASTTWHTTFNTLIVLLVFAALALGL